MASPESGKSPLPFWTPRASGSGGAASAPAAGPSSAAPAAPPRGSPRSPSVVSESQPLLPRASEAPILARCLLRVSGRTLHLCLWACFLVHLVRTGKLHGWWRDVLVTLEADVLCLLVFAGSNIGAITLANIDCRRLAEIHPCCGPMFIAVSLLVHAILCWVAMVRMCLLHELPLKCMFKYFCKFTEKGGSHIPHVPLTHSLVWFPLGFFLAVADMLWRPWHFYFYAVPMSVAGHKHVVEEMPWWQVREVIVGSMFWCGLVMVVYFANSQQVLRRDPADRRYLLLVTLFFALFCTLLVYYLTVPPLVAFWQFLAWPVLVLFHSLLSWSPPKLSVEEWIATFVLTWYIGRCLYIGTKGRLEQWSARSRMEETLRDALAHPYRAELEQGFGLVHGEHSGLGLAATLRSLGMNSQDRARGLRDKQRKLIDARKKLLLRTAGGRAVLPNQLHLSVHRERILEDTVLALFDRPVSELLAPKVIVKFEGEQGLDAGGLTREWFDAVGRSLSDGAADSKGGSLLTLAPDQTLIPRRIGCESGDVPLEQQERFRALLALGRIMALAVFHEQPLAISFSPILFKHLLRVPVGMGDVRQLDPDFYSLRVARILKHGGVAEINAALGEPLMFLSAGSDACPEPQELKPGGALLPVTDENKTEYVQLLCEAYLCGGIRREIQCLLQGFWEVLPPEVLEPSELSPRELSMLLSGVVVLDASEWRKHSAIPEVETQVHRWFWEVVQEFDMEQRSKLLHFVTGSSRLPFGGFVDLRPPFSVWVTNSGTPEHLPHSHTCTNQIVLHEYRSKEELKAKLLPALLIEEFGFM